MIAIGEQCYEAADEYGRPDSLVMGANIAAFALFFCFREHLLF